MMAEITAKMWGIFDKTGIFLSLCRHGFVLIIATWCKAVSCTVHIMLSLLDLLMLISNSAKYPLAVTEHLLRIFGHNLGGGYDIGCKFGGTINRSPLRPLARENSHKSLVGAFHRHAHNCLCQLTHLATCVKGAGLEDLEGCERFFSGSNELVPSLRHSSIFHRQQAISAYCRHTDTFDTYANLITFLLNNYSQALDILNGRTALVKAMGDLGIAHAGVFDVWLQEERDYLKGLAKEPPVETLEMEYYQKLVNFHVSEYVLLLLTFNLGNTKSYTG
jgi:hypothetical protein